MDFKFQVLKFPLGTSETFLCLKLVRPSKAVPPPGVPLRQIEYVVIRMSSEWETITLRFDIITSSLLQVVLIVSTYSCFFVCVCFICFLITVICYLCLYVVLVL